MIVIIVMIIRMIRKLYVRVKRSVIKILNLNSNKIDQINGIIT